MTKQQRIDRVKCIAFDNCTTKGTTVEYLAGMMDMARLLIDEIEDEPEEQTAFVNLKPMEFEIKLDKDQLAKATGLVSE